MFCEASNLESVLAYIRTLFSNNAVHNVARTAAENMYFSPVRAMNADEKEVGLLSCCLLFRFLGAVNSIVY